MVFLSLGSNLGNRLENIRKAIGELSAFFDCKIMSHIIETEAILPENAPLDWNIPYLNAVIVGDSHCSPFELLSKIKNIEKKMGRDLDTPDWSPRVIDVDIISYYNQPINSDRIVLPHKEIEHREFLQYLLREVGYQLSHDMLNNTNYRPLNHFVLDPKIVGIVNVTPDSFSDGGQYMDADKAEAQVRKIYAEGAHIVELGPQTTKPGYIEVPPSEEIDRLSGVLERCGDINCIGVDTYFDDVVRFAIEKHNVRWINDQNAILNQDTIRLIADNNVKLVTMLHGMDISWIPGRIKILMHFGMPIENIIIDPGIGFGKTKYQNIEMIRNCRRIKEIGCEVLLGHSRKSFMEIFSNLPAPQRDIETLAISSLADDAGVDYIRIHNVQDHMRFFVAKYFMNQDCTTKTAHIQKEAC
ncbi:folate synthesis bifunctional protein [Alphaproteobacteria bacterium]|nr:folate synthesis bifunctional protein [Alphaproteobacteria bacterium]